MIYFISYCSKRFNDSHWEFENKIIDEHPLTLFAGLSKSAPTRSRRYVLIFWQQIDRKFLEDDDIVEAFDYEGDDA